MKCRCNRLKWCPECHRVWCVPALVGAGEVVWHRECGVALAPLEGGGEHVTVTRGVVSWFADTARNEVRDSSEGP